MPDNVLNIETLHQYNTLIGQRTLHPLVSIVDTFEAKQFKNLSIRGNFYALLFKQVRCGNTRFRRKCHDFQTGTLVFKSPGEVVELNKKTIFGQNHILGILFHPIVLNEAPLIHKKSDYSFFSYRENESLHLSEQEKQIILNCTNNLQKELSRDIDKFSLRLIAVHLELLMDYCLRFYERQFITRTNINQDILAHFNRCLEKYFQSERPEKTELRAIEFAREEIPQSLAYLNDLIRSESGKTLREYTRFKRIEMTKELIRTSDKTLPEIATGLGFTDSRTLFCLFKKIVGSTPEEYKKKWGYPSNELPS